MEQLKPENYWIKRIHAIFCSTVLSIERVLQIKSSWFTASCFINLTPILGQLTPHVCRPFINYQPTPNVSWLNPHCGWNKHATYCHLLSSKLTYLWNITILVGKSSTKVHLQQLLRTKSCITVDKPYNINIKYLVKFFHRKFLEANRLPPENSESPQPKHRNIAIPLDPKVRGHAAADSAAGSSAAVLRIGIQCRKPEPGGDSIACHGFFAMSKWG